MRRRNLPEKRHCDAGTLAMPDVFSEAVHGFEHLFRHEHHDAPQQAAAPAITHNETQEPQEVPPMSFLAEVEADAHALAAKLAAVDHDALDALERVQANPDTAKAFALLAQATTLAVGPGVLTTAIDVMRMTLAAVGGQQPQPIASDAQQAPPQQPVPLGPVVAGQA